MLENKTNGSKSSEGKLSLYALILGAITILSQVAGKLFLNVDLGIDIEGVFYSLTGVTGLYTLGRSFVKNSVLKNVDMAEPEKEEKPEYNDEIQKLVEQIAVSINKKIT